MNFKKIGAVIGTASLLAVGAVVGIAGPASAHTAALTGTVACNTTDGSATITWTLSNDYKTPFTVANSTDPAIPDATVVPKNNSITKSENVAAPAAGKSVTATFDAEWRGYTQPGVTATATVPTDCTVSKAYQTVVWQMPTKPTNANSATWPQTLVSHTPEATRTLDVDVPTTCGTYYQVDSYYDSATTDALIEGGTLTSPNHPAEDLAPGGLNTAWRFVINPDCPVIPTDAQAAVNVTQSTCSQPGTATYTVKYAELEGTLDTTPGDHSATFAAEEGHEFADGSTTLVVPYTVAGATGDCATAAQTMVAATCTSAAVLTLSGTDVTWAGTTDGTKGPGAFDSTATTTEGHEFSDGTTVKHFTGSLAGAIGYQSTNPKADCYQAVVPAASVTKPGLAETGSDVTVGLLAGLIALLGGAAFASVAIVRRRLGTHS